MKFTELKGYEQEQLLGIVCNHFAGGADSNPPQWLEDTPLWVEQGSEGVRLWFMSESYKKPTLLAVRSSLDGGVSIRTSDSEHLQRPKGSVYGNHATREDLKHKLLLKLKVQGIAVNLVKRLSPAKAVQAEMVRALGEYL